MALRASKFGLILLSALTLFSFGCGGSSTVDATLLSGFVKDLNTGDGVIGADVEVGGLHAATDALGFFRLGPLAQGEQTVTISRGGYFDLVVGIEVRSGTNVLPDQILIPLDAVTENPYVVSSNPLQGATGVSLGRIVEITFSEPVRTDSLTHQSVLVSPFSTITSSQEGPAIRFTPIDQLKPDTKYALRLTRGITDLDDKPLVNEFFLSFTTAGQDLSPPNFIGSSPGAGAVNVGLSSPLSITFNEEITATGLKLTIEPEVEGQLAVAGRTVTFSNSGGFAPDTFYSGLLEGTVSDLQGNSLLMALPFDFTTGEAVGSMGNLEPAFSPDGRQIAFASNRDGDFDIWCIDADGEGLKNITDDTFDNRHPSWAPDYSGIVFSSTRGGNTDIYLMSQDGSDEVRLTENPALDIEPEFGSTFNLKIYFSSDREGDFLLYEMNSSGGGLQPVSPFSPNDDREPTLSPVEGASWLLFTSTKDGDPDVWYKSANPAYLQAYNLTWDFTGNESSPAWEKGGDPIYFASDENGSLDIWTALFPGGALELLSRDDSANEYSPAVSPIPGDARLLVVSDHEGEPDLYFMDSIGGELIGRLIAGGG